jgi:hypothetical protein
MHGLRDTYERDREAQAIVFERMMPRQHELVLLFSRVLGASLRAVPQRELPRIDALFEVAVPALHYGFQGLVPPYWRVGVTGSFVHGGGGRYLAAFDGDRCEIADLLLVVEYRLFGGASARNAVLLQAKKPLTPPAKPWSDGSGPTQFELYSRQPKFVWDPAWVAADRPGEERALKPDAVDCPCPWSWDEFGVRHWSRWGDWPTHGPIYGGALFAPLNDDDPWVVPPIDPMLEPRLLASTLVDVITFVGGYPFVHRRDAYLTSELEWSAVIWDLLRSSLHRHYRKVRPDRTPLQLLEGEQADPPGDDVDENGNHDERGVSVVRIVFVMQD